MADVESRTAPPRGDAAVAAAGAAREEATVGGVQPRGSRDGQSRVGAWLQVVSTIGPPLTIVTALLFYFGWARSAEQARFLGVDESILGMSTQDYLMRSISSLFLPLAAAAAIGLGWLWVHDRVLRLADDPRRVGLVTWGCRVLSVSWLALPLAGLAVSAAWPQGAGLVVPLSCTFGILLSAYAVSVSQRLPAGAPEHERPAWHSALTRVLVSVLVALTLFWAVSNYAQVVGRGLGQRIAADISALPAAVMYSPTRLHLGAPGVEESVLAGARSPDRFRYRGLRLLQRTGGRFFLLSDGWNREDGVLVIIDDDDPVRLEFGPGAAR